MADFRTGSALLCLIGSAALDTTVEGPWRLSGLLVRAISVSRVVTCTLSVLRSSTFLLVRWAPDGALLCAVPLEDG